MIQAAIGGQAVTQVFEGEKRFDLMVRWLEPYRRTVDAIRQITVSTPDGSQIPLGQIAKIELVDGPSVIYREDGRRYAPVKFSVRGRDLASAIGEASSRDRVEGEDSLRDSARVGGGDQRAARGRGPPARHHSHYASA